MVLKRMDNVGIVVDDVGGTIDFFRELGLEIEGRATVEGEWAGRVTGLSGQRVEIATMRTPDGHGRLELSAFSRRLSSRITAMPRGTLWAISASCSPWTTSKRSSKASTSAARSS